MSWLLSSTIAEMFRSEVQMPSRPRQGGEGKMPVIPSEREGDFATYHGPHQCQSRAGRWRAWHSWDKDGACVFCPERREG